MKKSIIPALAAALAATAACSGAPASRSGAPAEPVTLRSAWGQDPGGVGGDVLHALIQVTADGPVTVEEGDRTVGAVPSNNEIDAVKVLMAGDADLTVVRTGAVQELGAASLAPLGAPFVVTNNEQAAAIAADASIREAVLADLDGMGLVGAGAGARWPAGTRSATATSRCSEPATTRARRSTCVATPVSSRSSRGWGPSPTTRSTASGPHIVEGWRAAAASRCRCSSTQRRTCPRCRPRT